MVDVHARHEVPFAAHDVLGYLALRGFERPHAKVIELEGGVSSVVLRVNDSSGDLIVKRSLPRLRVAEEWLAPQERTIIEAEAMVLATSIVENAVPQVVMVDETNFALAMQAAPASWTDWKSQLLAGTTNDRIAARVGTIIGLIHRATAADGVLSAALCASEPFEQLRLRPYYEHAGRAAPRWAPVLSELADDLRANPRCLVHGDLSPKNILASPDVEASDVWIIDFEVAHRGDPRFDLAFLLTHLTMKAVHLPHQAHALDTASRSFIDCYTQTVGPELKPDLLGMLRHVGALLLSRLYGKSPAEYLTASERDHVERLAALAMEGRVSTLDELVRDREDTRA